MTGLHLSIDSPAARADKDEVIHHQEQPPYTLMALTATAALSQQERQQSTYVCSLL